MNIEEIKKYSGQDYRPPKRIEAPEIRLQAVRGVFVLNKRENDAWVNEDIGDILSGVILRVRRKLVNFQQKIISSEHNAPNDYIHLFGADEEGIARELREKHQTLKTNQLLYILTEDDNLIRLNVRGASLGSQNKPKDSVPLYEYLGSFEGDDHVWMYETKFIPKEEKGKLGSYYAIHFERGEKCNDERIQKIGEKMKYLYEAFLEQDKFYASDKKVINKEVQKEVDTVDYEEKDEVRPEDINF